jgi:hypothetical protein
MKKIIVLYALILCFQNIFAQRDIIRNSAKQEKIISNVKNPNLMLQEKISVLIYFPKSAFTLDQINAISSSENHYLEVSSQSIVPKSGCTENALVNRTFSNCWTKSTSINPIGVIAEKYTLITGKDSNYYTIEATVNYNRLAPKTALLSAFLDKSYLQTIRAGNWKVEDKTFCTFTLPESRWPEFVFSPNIGTRGFALRGNVGADSICSSVPPTTTVELWVVAPN